MSAESSVWVEPAEGVTVRIRDRGRVLELDYDGAVCSHPGSLWWGTAVGFRTMQAAARALSRGGLWDREHLYIVSGHPGPGVLDAIDYVADVSRRGRYKAVMAEGCGMQCNSKMKYEWWVSDGERTANINLRPDFVPRDFYDLSDRLGTPQTTPDDVRAFRIYKVNLSTRIWATPLEDNFRVVVDDQPLTVGEVPAEALTSDYFG